MEDQTAQPKLQNLIAKISSRLQQPNESEDEVGSSEQPSESLDSSESEGNEDDEEEEEEEGEESSDSSDDESEEDDNESDANEGGAKDEVKVSSPILCNDSEEGAAEESEGLPEISVTPECFIVGDSCDEKLNNNLKKSTDEEVSNLSFTNNESTGVNEPFSQCSSSVVSADKSCPDIPGSSDKDCDMAVVQSTSPDTATCETGKSTSLSPPESESTAAMENVDDDKNWLLQSPGTRKLKARQQLQETLDRAEKRRKLLNMYEVKPTLPPVKTVPNYQKTELKDKDNLPSKSVFLSDDLENYLRENSKSSTGSSILKGLNQDEYDNSSEFKKPVGLTKNKSMTNVTRKKPLPEEMIVNVDGIPFNCFESKEDLLSYTSEKCAKDGANQSWWPGYNGGGSGEPGTEPSGTSVYWLLEQGLGRMLTTEEVSETTLRLYRFLGGKNQRARNDSGDIDDDQPSKGKVYGRRADGKFASKVAVHNTVKSPKKKRYTGVLKKSSSTGAATLRKNMVKSLGMGSKKQKDSQEPEDTSIVTRELAEIAASALCIQSTTCRPDTVSAKQRELMKKAPNLTAMLTSGAKDAQDLDKFTKFLKVDCEMKKTFTSPPAPHQIMMSARQRYNSAAHEDVPHPTSSCIKLGKTGLHSIFLFYFSF